MISRQMNEAAMASWEVADYAHDMAWGDAPLGIRPINAESLPVSKAFRPLDWTLDIGPWWDDPTIEDTSDDYINLGKLDDHRRYYFSTRLWGSACA